MQRLEHSGSSEQQDLHVGSSPVSASGLSRNQKRALRQKRAKLFKRAAVQESSHSEAAEDYALQLAYEQHLRQLQQHHPQQEHAGQQQQPKQQQQQQQCAPGGGGKRRRRSGGYGGAGAVPTAPALAGSVDTLASSAALGVPAAHPSQRLAQISELSAEGAVAAEPATACAGAAPRQQASAGGAAARQQAAAAGAAGPAAAASSGLAPHLHDWSAPAALLGAALMRAEEAGVARQAAAKTAGICRLDLSAAALLIHTQLAPGPSTAAAAAAEAIEPAVPAAAAAAAVAAGPDDCSAVEDATEAAAGGGAAQPPAQQGQEQQERRGAKRQRREQPYVHGNYHRYYGYRYFSGGSASASGSGAEQGWQFEDPRLAVFERRWFARRRCLDVGCNEGLLTLALANRFGPRSMLGVDIDGGLIGKACRHLSEARTAAAQRVRASRRGGVPPDERRAAQQAVAALSQTLFVHSDFLDSTVEAGSLDTITCLSVTKWVHLNRGDEGLQALFASFHRTLAPGGLLLLEPQPWRSYKKAGDKVRREAAPPGSFFHRLHELRLHPDGFADYLCSQLGFRLLKQFGVEGPASAGFDRPMLLLRKPRPRPAAPSGQQEWREAEQAAEQRWRQEEGQAAAADAEQEEDAWLEGEGEDGEEPWEQTTAEEAQ